MGPYVFHLTTPAGSEVLRGSAVDDATAQAEATLFVSEVLKELASTASDHAAIDLKVKRGDRTVWQITVTMA